MEYIDVLDKDGRPTGQTKPKPEVHRDGDWHRTVHVWVINSKGELLIQRRAPTVSNHPNEWDIPSAGHISAGENSINSAMRETEEELGLKLTEADFEYLFSVTQQSVSRGGTYINNEFSDVYLVKMDTDPKTIKFQEDEVAEVKSIPFQELEKTILQKDPTFVRHPAEYEKLFEELRKRYS